MGAGYDCQELETLRVFLDRKGPQDVIDRTVTYWRLWLDARCGEFPDPGHGGLSKRLVDLYNRSLLVIRTQIDNSGAIIAANDSDNMQFARDTYSYLWPRDGALVAKAVNVPSADISGPRLTIASCVD